MTDGEQRVVEREAYFAAAWGLGKHDGSGYFDSRKCRRAIGVSEEREREIVHEHQFDHDPPLMLVMDYPNCALTTHGLKVAGQIVERPDPPLTYGQVGFLYAAYDIAGLGQRFDFVNAATAAGKARGRITTVEENDVAVAMGACFASRAYEYIRPDDRRSNVYGSLTERGIRRVRQLKAEDEARSREARERFAEGGTRPVNIPPEHVRRQWEIEEQTAREENAKRLLVEAWKRHRDTDLTRIVNESAGVGENEAREFWLVFHEHGLVQLKREGKYEMTEAGIAEAMRLAGHEDVGGNAPEPTGRRPMIRAVWEWFWQTTNHQVVGALLVAIIFSSPLWSRWIAGQSASQATTRSTSQP